MKVTRRTLTLLFPILALISLILIPLVSAAPYERPPAKIKTGQDFIDAIHNVAGFLFQIFMALSVIFILVAALFYLTAAGNQTQLDKAKNILIFAIVAIVIALLAGGIVQFIGDIANKPLSGGSQNSGSSGGSSGGTSGGGSGGGLPRDCPEGYEFVPKPGNQFWCVKI